MQEPLYYQSSDFGDMHMTDTEKARKLILCKKWTGVVSRDGGLMSSIATHYAVGDADPAPATADPDNIPNSQPDSGDDWEAKTIGLADSNSVIDTERYCGKIKGWNQHCSDFRKRLPLTPA